MTVGECNLYIKLYNIRQKEKAKEQITLSYQLATMTSQFVNYALAGKKLPPLEDYLPQDIITDDTSEEFKAEHNGMTKREWDRMCLQRDQFRMMAEVRKANKEKRNGSTVKS